MAVLAGAAALVEVAVEEVGVAVNHLEMARACVKDAHNCWFKAPDEGDARVPAEMAVAYALIALVERLDSMTEEMVTLSGVGPGLRVSR